MSLLLLVFAVWISYRTLQESQKFGSTMIAQMDTLSTLFTEVNDQISYLPTSVSRFDSTVKGLTQGMSNQQRQFQESITESQGNIDSFSKGIADYEKSLAKIVEASDRQLALLDKRQEFLEKELMRKPALKLEAKECIKDTLGRLSVTPQIVNKGDEVAGYWRIVLRVPREFDFQSSGFVVWDSTARMQGWSCEFPTFIPYSPRVKAGFYPRMSDRKMTFSVKIPQNVKPPYKLEYVLYHNKGEDYGELVIPLPK